MFSDDDTWGSMISLLGLYILVAVAEAPPKGDSWPVGAPVPFQGLALVLQFIPVVVVLLITTEQ